MVYTSSAIFSSLVGKAQELDSLFPGVRFIPAYASRTGKKPPCKGVNTLDGHTLEELSQFDSMTCLGVLPETRFVILDCDGSEAVNYVRSRLIDSPVYQGETLNTWSLKDDHEAFWFLLPPGISLRDKEIKLGDSVLEIRTGKRYQVIAGEHPLYDSYKSNEQPIRTITLEELDALFLEGENEAETVEEYEGDPTLQDAYNLITYMIDLDIDYVSDPHYHDFLKVGMALKEIAPTEEGIKCWNSIIEYWQNKNFDPDHQKWYNQTRDKWRTFRGTANSLTLGTFVHHYNAWIDQGLESIHADQEKQKLADVAVKKASRKSSFLQEEQDKQSQYEFDLKGLFEGKDNGGFELEWAIVTLARKYGRSEKSIQRDWAFLLELERYRVDGIDPTQTEWLQSFPDHLWDVLPNGRGIQADLNLQGMPEIAGLLSYFCALDGILPKGDRYLVRQNMPTVPSMIAFWVGDSGTGKSDIFKLFKQYLTDKQEKEDLLYQDIKKAWKEQEKRWKEATSQEKKQQKNVKEESEKLDPSFRERFEGENRKDIEDPGEEPEPFPPYFLTDGTIQGGRNENAANNAHGIVWEADEFVSFFKAIAGNNSTAAQDRAAVIRLYQGDRISHVMAGKKERLVGQWQMSLIGTIQPKILEEEIDFDDEQGVTARFLMIPLDNFQVKNKIEGVSDTVDGVVVPSVLELITPVFDTVFNYEKEIIKTTPEAGKLWDQWSTKTRALSLEGDRFTRGFCLWLRKANLHVLRFAGRIHDLRRAGTQLGLYQDQNNLAKLSDPHRIDLFSMQLAINLMDHICYIEQDFFETMASGKSKKVTHSEYEVILERIKTLETNGTPATPRTILQGKHFRKNKTSPDTLRNALQILTTTGKVTFEEDSKAYTVVAPSGAS
jgi:hypothetical protein